MKKFIALLCWASCIFVFVCGIIYSFSNGFPVFIKGLLYFVIVGLFGFFLWKSSSNAMADTILDLPVDPAVVSDALRSHGLDNNCVRCSVAGVSFKNEDGSERQYILRKIFFNDPPYDHVSVSVLPYDYNGDTAFGVYVNQKQIGNIPKQYVQRLIDDNDCFCGIENFEVYGGGECEDGSRKNYGATLDLIFK